MKGYVPYKICRYVNKKIKSPPSSIFRIEVKNKTFYPNKTLCWNRSTIIIVGCLWFNNNDTDNNNNNKNNNN